MNNTCLIGHHQEKPIITVCLAPQCKNQRMCCSQCQGEFHKNHYVDQSVDFSTLYQFILNKSLDQSQSTIEVTQIKKELDNILQGIDQLAKLVKREIQRLSSDNLQQFCLDLANQYNIFTQEIGNQQWNQLAQDMLSRFELRNNQIIEKNQLGQPYLTFLCQFSQNMIKIVKQVNISNQIFDHILGNMNYQLQQKPLQNNSSQKKNVIDQNPFIKFTKCNFLKGKANKIIQLDICEYRDLLVSLSTNSEICVWDLVKNTKLQQFRINGVSKAISISNLGNLLAYGERNKRCEYHSEILFIKDISNLQKNFFNHQFSRLEEHKGKINRIIFSKDQIYLFSSGDDYNVIIWNVQKQTKIGQFCTEEIISGLAISSDNKFIATHSSIVGIQIWNTSDQSLILTHKAHNFGIGIEFSKFQNKLVSSGSDGIINIFDYTELYKGRLIQERSFKIAQKGIQKVQVTSDSKYILALSNDDGFVKVIDSDTGQEMKVFKQKNQIANLQDQNIRGLLITDQMNMIMYGDGDDIAVWRMI